jgi:hypothetical protein
MSTVLERHWPTGQFERELLVIWSTSSQRRPGVRNMVNVAAQFDHSEDYIL